MTVVAWHTIVLHFDITDLLPSRLRKEDEIMVIILCLTRQRELRASQVLTFISISLVFPQIPNAQHTCLALMTLTDAAPPQQMFESVRCSHTLFVKSLVAF